MVWTTNDARTVEMVAVRENIPAYQKISKLMVENESLKDLQHHRRLPRSKKERQIITTMVMPFLVARKKSSLKDERKQKRRRLCGRTVRISEVRKEMKDERRKTVFGIRVENNENEKADEVEKSSVKDVGEHSASLPTKNHISPGQPQSSWPGEMLKAVLGHFGKMPRGGWPLCSSLYCEKFVCAISLQELKKQANAANISIAGCPCSQKRFLEESAKRIKAQDTYFQKNTLHQSKVYLDVQEKYLVLNARRTRTCDGPNKVDAKNRKFIMAMWIVEFLRSITSRWSGTSKNNEEAIMERKMQREIVQGDSLSSLLFVLCMDPLSRRLNIRHLR
ncbi:unnamed protein product [Thelazia callipaeda]|uniref:Reverse transcriptase domain-containing protein n=1 Tax=Thelazia callipaeda TaxID=103827 RepID=A0A0N5D4D4_THECL|nr:unnamed protein product [Thelazia callipaeda]